MDDREPIKILIVDDEPSKLLSLAIILEQRGLEIVTVPSGREALRRLLTDDFALVLLDVNMPEIDGFETAALIRQREKTEHTPIIFVTGYHDDTLALQSYSLGAVDYIITPVVPEVLRAKVQVFAELYRMQCETRRQAQAEVHLAQEQAARVAAERANRAKSDFLANVSHELRTPMNAIIGMTDLALEEDLNPAARDYLTTARASAYVLLGLLNEILDLSRLESGKFTLDHAPFDLREVVNDTVKTISVRAFEKHLEVSVDFPEAVPTRVIGDPLRVRQVFMNLLGNAIKFTQRGEIALQLEPTEAPVGHVGLRISVSDTGIGISDENQRRIFAPFTQADASMTRNYGGTGLGLAIASDLVQRMGGRMWVQSRLCEGSTFYFTLQLPLDPAAPREAADADHGLAAFDGLEVPIVDENPLHRQVLAGMLRGWSLEPIPLEDEPALLRLHEQQRGRPFPLLVVVALNGECRVQHLLERIVSQRIADAVLLVISATDRQASAPWLKPLKRVHCHEKPLFRRELRRSLRSILAGVRESSAAKPDPQPIPAERPLRILVAEDTPANQKLLLVVLRKRGHVVELARDGREAFDLARDSDFDVVLMDVQMPVMDGMQATAAIRTCVDPRRRDVPIIAMTAHAMEGDRERFLAAGMDGYVTKPIHSQGLIELLESRYAPQPADST
jgi:two-component system sensor histidine kinase/response regulator